MHAGWPCALQLRENTTSHVTMLLACVAKASAVRVTMRVPMAAAPTVNMAKFGAPAMRVTIYAPTAIVHGMMIAMAYYALGAMEKSRHAATRKKISKLV